MAFEMTLPFVRDPALSRVGPKVHHEIEQFLFDEAGLIDERRLEAWTELLADDLRYYAPTRYNRAPRERAREWAGPREAAHFDDDKQMMQQRVKRLQTDRAWSEDPPSRTRHLVTNVRARSADDTAFEVDSNFIVYRARGDDCEEWFVGARHDALRRATTPWGFEIVTRVILFDHTAIPANNLGIFF